MKKSIDLIQPKFLQRSPWHMPSWLLIAAARIKEAGVRVNLFDENFQKYSPTGNNNIWIGLIWSPHIPMTLAIRKRIIQANPNAKIILWWQIISSLKSEQLDQLFQNHINWNIDWALADALGINSSKLPKPEETSLVSIYEQISDNLMKQYLKKEIVFYLSQWCPLACSFCSAIRTRSNPDTWIITRAKEIYRNFDIIEKDLSYLINRAKWMNLNSMKLGLTNLDLFRTPEKLTKFIKIVKKLSELNPNFEIKMSWLAELDTFLKTANNNYKLIQNLSNSWLKLIGFWADWLSMASLKILWKNNKWKTRIRKIEQAIQIATQCWITSFIWMLFGTSKEVDTIESLNNQIIFLKKMINQYNAIPTPFVTKNFIPWNDWWYNSKNQGIIRNIIKNPELFHALDFNAIASPTTHPDAQHRKIINSAYLEACKLDSLFRPTASRKLNKKWIVKTYYWWFKKEIKTIIKNR